MSNKLRCGVDIGGGEMCGPSVSVQVFEIAREPYVTMSIEPHPDPMRSMTTTRRTVNGIAIASSVA